MMVKKFFAIILIILLLLLVLELNSSGQNIDPGMSSSEIDKNGFLNGTYHAIEDSINNSFDKESIKKLIPGFDVVKILKDLSLGKFPLKFGDIIKKVLNIFFDEFIKILALGVRITGILMLIGLINNLKSSFGSQKVSEIAFYCGYLVISLMLYNVVQTGLQMTREIVKNTSDFMFAVYPILMGLMVSSGQIVSSVIIKPFYIMSIVLMFSLLEKVILPMILFQTVIAFATNLTDKISIRSIGVLNKSIATWLLGGFMTIFVAVLSLQGSLGYSIDNVTAKTAKFTLNTFVPFVGKYIADASDTILACSMLLKNSAGVLATIILVGICLIPLIKAATISLLFKILGIIAEIVAEKKFAALLNDISHIFLILAGIIATIVIIFYISICFVMGSIKPV